MQVQQYPGLQLVDLFWLFLGFTVPIRTVCHMSTRTEPNRPPPPNRMHTPRPTLNSPQYLPLTRTIPPTHQNNTSHTPEQYLSPARTIPLTHQKNTSNPPEHCLSPTRRIPPTHQNNTSHPPEQYLSPTRTIPLTHQNNTSHPPEQYLPVCMITPPTHPKQYISHFMITPNTQ